MLKKSPRKLVICLFLSARESFRNPSWSFKLFYGPIPDSILYEGYLKNSSLHLISLAPFSKLKEPLQVGDNKLKQATMQNRQTCLKVNTNDKSKSKTIIILVFT